MDWAVTENRNSTAASSVTGNSPGAWQPDWRASLPLALLAALLIPESGWLVFAVFKLVLVFWLAACLAGVLIAGRFRRRMCRNWPSGYTRHGRHW